MAFSLNDLPPKQQWLASGALCFLLVGIYYMQFWRSNSRQITQTTTEIARLKGEVEQMRAIAGNLPELRQELSSLGRRLQVLAHILPEEYETADLLRGVGTLAAQSNLDIRDLEFRDPVPYEFYAESPIELELTGTYHDLARFFDRVGKFARIINVNEVSISALDGSDASVEATVTAMTFIFMEDEFNELAGEDFEELVAQ